MQRSHHFSLRLFLTLWAVALAIGFVVESSRAAIVYPSCEHICGLECEPHDGCDDYDVEGSSCLYLCLDGYLGEAVMGKR